jgi:OFA family oxalate/formate antiporter-like MFS transporter
MLILVGICIAVLVLPLNFGGAAVSAPAIGTALGGSPVAVNWILNAFMLSFGSSLMASGALADLFGRKRVFAIGVVLFALTSLGLAALPLALTIDRFTNGLTRPLFGWISDRLGRENTMCFAFALEGVAMALWLLTRDNAVLFVLLSGVVFFGWGEIFSLFPSTLTDTFGTRYATTNYGWLYISFGIGSIFGGPLAALLHQQTGSWVPVFGCAIALDLSTAALAMFMLKPARARFVRARG